MKRLIVIGLVAGLLAGAVGLPAEAAKKKKKKKPKPVATTLFMDGANSFGEQDQLIDGTFLTLGTAEPSSEKSHGIPNYVAGPNTNCAGNGLVPVFVGDLSGRVVGDMKVTFNAFASGGSVEIRVWPDVNAQACNDDYVPEAGAVEVPLPSGEGTVEAVIEGLDFTAESVMMIQLTPVIGGAPSFARAFYATADSKVEFECFPPKGAKACAPEAEE
ncbi:MAG: hypothetical protein ACRDKB_03915 [Actinomycetota bacterium]